MRVYGILAAICITGMVGCMLGIFYIAFQISQIKYPTPHPVINHVSPSCSATVNDIPVSCSVNTNAQPGRT